MEGQGEGRGAWGQGGEMGEALRGGALRWQQSTCMANRLHHWKNAAVVTAAHSHALWRLHPVVSILSVAYMRINLPACASPQARPLTPANTIILITLANSHTTQMHADTCATAARSLQGWVHTSSILLHVLPSMPPCRSSRSSSSRVPSDDPSCTTHRVFGFSSVKLRRRCSMGIVLSVCESTTYVCTCA